MRAALLVLLSGCSLYFTESHSGDDIPPPYPLPDAAVPVIDGGRASGDMARCEDGLLYRVGGDPRWDQAPHGAGALIGRCENPCRSAAVMCSSPSCEEAQTLCTAPASVGETCALAGTSCAGDTTLACPASTACSEPVTGSSCTCRSGVYACAQSTPAAVTQGKLVGKWRGTVTTPWVAPYTMSLWIYPDGSYWPECSDVGCSGFYYGLDGASPERKLKVLSTSATLGSWASIAIDFGGGAPTTGELSALVVDGTHLRFTYSASWLSCGQPISVDLVRER